MNTNCQANFDRKVRSLRANTLGEPALPRRLVIAASSVFATALAIAAMIWLPMEARIRAASNASIDDLTISATELFAQSSDVGDVEVAVYAPRPTHRIIHILDSHYLTRERYRRSNQPPSEEGYSQYLDAVVRLQASQRKLLLWLTDKHCLRRIFVEGMSRETQHRSAEWVKWIRQHREEAAGVGAAITELRVRLEKAEQDGKNVEELSHRIQLAETLRKQVLVLGAAGQVAVERSQISLLPPEDQEVRRAARKEYREGRTMGPANDMRQEAIVRNLLRRGPCSVIVLGRAHDLSDAVNHLGQGQCEYIRVTPKCYPQVIDRDGRVTWISE